MNVSLPRAARFYLRHAWRACFIAPGLADKWSTRAAWLAPALWLLAGSALATAGFGLVPDHPASWIEWWRWGSTPLLGIAGVLYVFAFLHSIWTDVTAVEADRDRFKSLMQATDVRATCDAVRRRLTSLLDEGRALLKARGSDLTEAEVAQFHGAIVKVLEEQVIHPTKCEFERRMYDRNPYGKTRQPRSWSPYFDQSVLASLAELIGELKPEHVRDGPVG